MPVPEGPVNLVLQALNRFLFLCSLKDCEAGQWALFKSTYLTGKLESSRAQAVWELVIYFRFSRENEQSDFLIDVILPKIVLCLSHEQGIEVVDLLLAAVTHARRHDRTFDYMLWRASKQILNLVKALLQDSPFELYDSDQDSYFSDTTDSDYSY